MSIHPLEFLREMALFLLSSFILLEWVTPRTLGLCIPGIYPPCIVLFQIAFGRYSLFYIVRKFTGDIVRIKDGI
jgi:hypothetical protein